MSLQRIAPWLIALLAVSVAGMMIAARHDLGAVTWAMGAAFVAGAITASLRTNSPYWDEAHTGLQPPKLRIATRRNTRLIALTYAWAGLAMQGLYTTPLTGLRWHHGWQYAAAFALAAFAAFFYARALGPDSDGAQRGRLERMAGTLAVAQGLAAGCGLIYLVGTRKMLSTRADWAANIVFVSAAMAIMVLTAISLRTHLALMRRAD